MDDITVFMEGRNKELAGIAEKALKSIKNSGTREGSEFDHGRRKRRAEQGDCVVQLLGRDFSGLYQKRSSGICIRR